MDHDVSGLHHVGHVVRVERTEEQADLLLFAETGSSEARYASGAYTACRLHLATLILHLRQMGPAAGEHQ